jgi:hypothetical protein
VEVEKSWRKVSLKTEDLKRITKKIGRVKDRKAPKGYKEVDTYCVDGKPIKGGIKKAEDELKRKIWEDKVRRAEKEKFRKGLFN